MIFKLIFKNLIDVHSSILYFFDSDLLHVYIGKEIAGHFLLYVMPIFPSIINSHAGVYLFLR